MFVGTSVLAAVLGGGIPNAPCAADQLSTSELTHHELLRLDRDFGKPQWQITLDGWADGAQRVQDLRFWWVNTDDNDSRKPFNRHLRRHVKFSFKTVSDGKVTATLTGDGRAYTFSVEKTPAGPVVYADVETASGELIERCRARKGRIIARRLLGIPIGVGALEVDCTDSSGRDHHAAVVHRPEPESASYHSP